MSARNRSTRNTTQWKLSARARSELVQKANADFRSIVRRAAKPMNLDLIDRLREECDLNGVELIGPILQYRANDPNRGRYFVVSSAPYPGHTRKLFRYVSNPLAARKTQELEDARIARELQDEGLRPISLGIGNIPLGNAAFMRALGLDRRARSRGTIAPSGRSTVPRGRRYRKRAEVAPPSDTRSLRRARSPSIEILQAPPRVVLDLTGEPRALRVLFYDIGHAAPQELLLEEAFPGSSYRFSKYASQWNSIEVKLSDSVLLLTGTPTAQEWHGCTVGDLAFPPSARRIILARRSLHTSLADNLGRLHNSVQSKAAWAYGGQILPVPIEID
ncbi:unnamed protein product [Peniophora sp. CBMAI 1063]|nr:unnamed protein product [Peniophora sp. CBMAI 1063]